MDLSEAVLSLHSLNWQCSVPNFTNYFLFDYRLQSPMSSYVFSRRDFSMHTYCCRRVLSQSVPIR